MTVKIYCFECITGKKESQDHKQIKIKMALRLKMFRIFEYSSFIGYSNESRKINEKLSE